jgi:hypothetical protein
MAVVLYPPDSPDLAPCDFFLFLRMKLQLKGCRFQDVSEIQEQSQTIHVIPKFQLQWYFQQWQKGWTHCIYSEKGTTSKVTTTTNNKGKHIFHY